MLQSQIPNHPSPRDYIPDTFFSQTWQKTYCSNISPISLMEITGSNQVSAPKKERNPQGRPKLKRFTAGEQRKVSQAQAKLNKQDPATRERREVRPVGIVGIMDTTGFHVEYSRRSCIIFLLFFHYFLLHFIFYYKI